MQLHEKIKYFRRSKGFTQEQIAEKLNITPVAYSNIERGESSVSMKRLEEIARIIEVELLDLLSLGERNIMVLHGDTTNSPNSSNSFLRHVNFPDSSNELSVKLEKANLLLEQQAIHIALLQQEIEHLKEIITLLKKST
jgi:transcriptional regulator with XRE-family HTH domain